MSWLSKYISWISGGVVFLAFSTGFNRVIYRTLMNYGSGIFCYLLAKFVNFGTWVIGLLPALPSDSTYRVAVENLIFILGRANTYFPVLEFVGIFVIVFLVMLVLSVVRIVLKFVPTLG